MEEEQMEEELPPMMRIEPFAKMSQILPQHQDRQATLPVKFRRNVLEESPQVPPEDDDFRQGTDIQAYHKPARHMRAQPRVSYGAMDPDQRRQAELRDTALSRQQLLLRQQQEVMAYTHQQQVEQQAQHLVNSTFAVKTSSATTGAPAHQQHHSDRERLGSLLNEACVLAPQPVPGTAWTPTQMPVISQGYYNPVTVLPNTGVPVSAIPPPGAPGPLMFLGRDELMQQVRKELRRMQQE